MVKKTAENDTITIVEIKLRTVRVNIVGTSPLVPHAMSFKAQQSLLYPSMRKNATERATSMKHEPFEEYRNAAYVYADEEKQPVRMYMPASSIHSAMSNVALDMVGARKAQIARLTSVPGMKLPLYGIPKIYRTMVRSSDPQRTPDVRTLPILEKWALPGVVIEFVDSLISEQSIINLLANSGAMVGIGDGRKEKGKLSQGSFRICNDTDAELREIMKTGTLKAQDAALANPQYYDIERLLTWFLEEKKTRVAAPAPSRKKHIPDAAVIDASGKKGKRNGLQRTTAIIGAFCVAAAALWSKVGLSI
jgi:hypothetical protein